MTIPGNFLDDNEYMRPEPTAEDILFRQWVATLPDTHWARYDLSACRLGWDAGRAALLADISNNKETGK